jgi:signal transduction histidine kinase
LRVRAELVDDDETRESLIASVEEMQVMVEATLTFARGLSVREEPQDVEVDEFIADLCASMVDPCEIRGGPAGGIRLRPHALRRALRNVIENAARYGGGAEIAWRRAGGELVIEIADRGPGIPEEERERVFDPFYRLEQSRSLETGGHGLGLSIARSILRAQGGEIVLSDRPGGGLLAVVHLPLTLTAEHEAHAAGSEPERHAVPAGLGRMPAAAGAHLPAARAAPPDFLPPSVSGILARSTAGKTEPR